LVWGFKPLLSEVEICFQVREHGVPAEGSLRLKKRFIANEIPNMTLGRREAQQQTLGGTKDKQDI